MWIENYTFLLLPYYTVFKASGVQGQSLSLIPLTHSRRCIGLYHCHRYWEFRGLALKKKILLASLGLRMEKNYPFKRSGEQLFTPAAQGDFSIKSPMIHMLTVVIWIKSRNWRSSYDGTRRLKYVPCLGRCYKLEGLGCSWSPGEKQAAVFSSSRCSSPPNIAPWTVPGRNPANS